MAKVKSKQAETAYQKCINPDCGATFDCGQDMFKCPKCGELLDIQYDWDKAQVPAKISDFAKRWATRSNRLDFSGVWRFRELLNFCPDNYKVTLGEGQTILATELRHRQTFWHESQLLIPTI